MSRLTVLLLFAAVSACNGTVESVSPIDALDAGTDGGIDPDGGENDDGRMPRPRTGRLVSETWDGDVEHWWSYDDRSEYPEGSLEVLPGPGQSDAALRVTVPPASGTIWVGRWIPHPPADVYWQARVYVEEGGAPTLLDPIFAGVSLRTGDPSHYAGVFLQGSQRRQFYLHDTPDSTQKFGSSEEQVWTPGQWYCLEGHLAEGAFEASFDGTQVFSEDGLPRGTISAVFLTAQGNADAAEPVTMWFDDVLVDTEPLEGCAR